MLIYLYLFSMVLGGILLGASILLGGKDAHGDDAHADGHDKDVDHVLDKELSHGDGAGDFFLWSIRSVRFWTFFTAFFGATGLTLDGLDLASQWVALGAALGMGALTGFGAAAVIRALSTDTSSEAATAKDYVGKTVRVVVPVEANAVGKVRLQLQGTDVEVLATTEEAEAFSKEEEAIIIEMDGTRARIARLEAKG